VGVEAVFVNPFPAGGVEVRLARLAFVDLEGVVDCANLGLRVCVSGCVLATTAGNATRCVGGGPCCAPMGMVPGVVYKAGPSRRYG